MPGRTVFLVNIADLIGGRDQLARLPEPGNQLTDEQSLLGPLDAFAMRLAILELTHQDAGLGLVGAVAMWQSLHKLALVHKLVSDQCASTLSNR